MRKGESKGDKGRYGWERERLRVKKGEIKSEKRSD